MTAVDLLQSQVTQEQATSAIKGWLLSAPSPPPEIVLDTPGTPENAFIYSLSLGEANRSDDRARYARAGYRATAPLEYLRLHAIDVFGLPVQTAGFATTNERIINASGNQYGPFEPGELRFVHRTTKALYENTEPIVIQPAQLAPFVPNVISVGVRALEPGTGSNASPQDINRLETPLEGVDVTNLQAALTTDDENSESINRRIDASIGIVGVAGGGGLSTGGPASAVESIALNGRDRGGGCLRPDGSRVTVTRTKIIRDDSTGITTLYVGDDDGPLEPLDLGIVSAEVQWYGQRVCSRVQTLNALLKPIAIFAAIKLRNTSLTDQQIIAAVTAAMPAAGLAVPMGGFQVGPPQNAVPREYMEGVIRGAAAGQWQTVDIAVTLPFDSVFMNANDVAQFTLGNLQIQRIP